MGIPGLLLEGGRAYRWSLHVTLRLQSYRFISIRERKALEMRRENMASKVGGGSSRSQEGREKTRRSPKGVQELWDGKRMAM